MYQACKRRLLPGNGIQTSATTVVSFHHREGQRCRRLQSWTSFKDSFHQVGPKRENRLSAVLQSGVQPPFPSPPPQPPSLPLSRQTVTLLKRFAGQGAGPRPLATSGLFPALFDEAEENDSDSVCPCWPDPSAQKRQKSTTLLTSTRTHRPDLTLTLTWLCSTFY